MAFHAIVAENETGSTKLIGAPNLSPHQGRAAVERGSCIEDCLAVRQFQGPRGDRYMAPRLRPFPRRIRVRQLPPLRNIGNKSASGPIKGLSRIPR